MSEICAVLGCDRPVRSRGLCISDYTKARRDGTLSLLTVSDRFYAKVLHGDGCWEWTGTRLPKGYGQFRHPDGRTVKAHRMAWELAHGEPAPEGLLVCHTCDNPPCVRPSYLFIGTKVDNGRDMADKGRGAHQRLLPADVLVIRARRAAGVFLKVLAAEYGVCEATISLAANGVTFPALKRAHELAVGA